ncbi:MAG: SRPBCC family protein [Ktedonobacterales bacterium]
MSTNQGEKAVGQPVVGQTKTVGFEVGARRTFAISAQEAWELLCSDEGLSIWLGAAPGLRLAVGESYSTKNGATGVIRVINPGMNVRLSWQPAGWVKASTVQVRTIPGGERTVISFHHEGLAAAAEREQMRRHWLSVLDRLQERLAHE